MQLHAIGSTPTAPTRAVTAACWAKLLGTFVARTGSLFYSFRCSLWKFIQSNSPRRKARLLFTDFSRAPEVEGSSEAIIASTLPCSRRLVLKNSLWYTKTALETKYLVLIIFHHTKAIWTELEWVVHTPVSDEAPPTPANTNSCEIFTTSVVKNYSSTKFLALLIFSVTPLMNDPPIRMQ